MIGERVTVEKFVRRFLGVHSCVFRIRLHENFTCKHSLTPQHLKFVAKEIFEHPLVFQALTYRHRYAPRYFKKNEHLTEQLIRFMRPEGKRYTFCLTNDELVFAETGWGLKDMLSKHVSICGINVCASGEMHVDNGIFVFNNSSGSFLPTVHDLNALKRALPFLKLRIETMSMRKTRRTNHNFKKTMKLKH